MVTARPRPLHPSTWHRIAAALVLAAATAAVATTTAIAWRAPEALETTRDPRPRLVYFHAQWCSWCRRFERETLSDPEVARRLSRDALPVRADADLHRALFRRLGGRGLPYVALLEPDGRLARSFTGLLAPGPFLDWLGNAPASRSAPPEILVDPDTFHTALEDLWDPEARRLHGLSLTGIEGTKRPQPLTARYLLEACHGAAACPDPAWRRRVPRLLDRMLDELEDPVDGGFYFYADPGGDGHTETAKRLERNVRMTGLYLAACLRLEKERYCRAARRGLDYLNAVLWDEATGAYLLGQHADSDYFSLEAAERRERTPPPLDPVFDTAANAQALILLLESRRLPEAPDPSHRIERLTIWLLHDARLPRGAYAAHRLSSEKGPDTPGPLYTQAWVATALLRAHQQNLPVQGAQSDAPTAALHRLLRYIGRFHYDPATRALSEPPAAEPSRYTHPAGSGRMALLLTRLPSDLCPAWADALLPGLLAQNRWRPGIELDDLVPAVQTWHRLQTSTAPPCG